MGTVVDSLFAVLMSWVRALVNGLWALFSQDNTTLLEFLGRNWLILAVVLVAAGLMIDWLVWLVRWQPYHIWAQRVRRLLRLPQEDEAEDGEGGERAGRAHPAVLPEKRHTAQWPREWDNEAAWEAQAAYAAYEAAGAPAADEEEEQAAIDRARSVPDEVLGAYPGMRYDSAQTGMAGMQETQRYSALTSEGPGAAEVSRRREEIDAYRRAQEEAAERARAERAAQMEAERLRQQEKQMEAERRAEEARLAQEAYARELAEYEIKRAQYERELAEYERQMAEYEAQRAAADAAKSARRRRREATYSDYFEGETVAELPDAPQWPQIDREAQPAKKKPTAAKTRKKADHQTEKPEKKSGLLNRVAKIMEGEEEEELASMHALPPRVDMHEAYRPAKKAGPEKKAGRRRSDQG